MDVKAFAKINLGLDVLCRRPDGYHEVSMIMQSIELCDELRLEPLCEDEIRLSMSGQGPDVPLDERNIIYKAARLMRETYGIEQGVSISAVKHIPSQAGLGGGSADAAAVLRGMNELFSLGRSRQELAELGLRLGADVPFCVMEGTALAEGIGERLTALTQAPFCHVLLCKPSEGISTKDIYEAIDGSGLMEDQESSRIRKEHMKELIRAVKEADRELLSGELFNIFEEVTAKRLPYIMELKERLMRLGAMGALMSGSGPTVYGLFRDRSALKEAYVALLPELWEGRLSELIRTGFLKDAG